MNIELLIWLVALPYLFFCAKYVLLDSFGTRVTGEVAYNNGKLAYEFDDAEGNRLLGSSTRYLRSTAHHGDPIEVVYLKPMPTLNMAADWLSMRFNQLIILGVAVGFTVGAGYGLVNYVPALSQQIAKLKSPQQMFSESIQNSVATSEANAEAGGLRTLDKPMWDRSLTNNNSQKLYDAVSPTSPSIASPTQRPIDPMSGGPNPNYPKPGR